VVVGVSVRRKREGGKEKKSQEKKFVHTWRRTRISSSVYRKEIKTFCFFRFRHSFASAPVLTIEDIGVNTQQSFLWFPFFLIIYSIIICMSQYVVLFCRDKPFGKICKAVWSVCESVGARTCALLFRESWQWEESSREQSTESHRARWMWCAYAPAQLGRNQASGTKNKCQLVCQLTLRPCLIPSMIDVFGWQTTSSGGCSLLALVVGTARKGYLLLNNGQVTSSHITWLASCLESAR
jgi:hypothetical protein